MPTHQKEAWLKNISRVLEDYDRKSPTERSTVVLALLRCPSVLLPQDKRPRHRRTVPSLSPEAILNAPHAAPAAQKNTDPEKRILNRATALAIEGHRSRAVKTLLQEVVPAIPDDELLARLHILHPERHDSVPLTTIPCPNKVELPSAMLDTVKRTSCGALHVGGRTTLVVRRHVSLTLDGLRPTHSGRPGGPYTLAPYIA